jgi:hypothetical protein
MNSNGPSSRLLRMKLTEDRRSVGLLQTEALYHAEVDWTCCLLDVVDEVADATTAERITGAIYDRLAGDAAADAAARVREAKREYGRIVRSGVPGAL